MKKIAFLITILFLVLGIFTLKDYGINWDTINHLPRGQAYLRFILTGEKDYQEIQGTFYASGNQYKDEKYWQDPTSLFIKVDPNELYAKTRSIYQNDNYTYEYFMKHDGYGHPPASDILSSFFNLVLFQKLKLINDIDSYRIYGVLLAAALVGLIFAWVSKKYGELAGFVSALSLATYPLFWAESHFNTEKDIPETAFWGIFLYLFYWGVTKKKVKYIFFSSIILGLAIGTKFNAVFLVFVIFPWLFYYALRNGWLKKPVSFIKENKLFLTSFFALPILAFVVFTALWPYLWPDLLGRLVEVIKFYIDIGINTRPDPRFLGPFGINTYPALWIFYTTYPFVLLLALFGVVKSACDFKKDKEGFVLLVAVWLLVPILRVSAPNTHIYGGVRQIMEFIPAIAILAGIGSSFLLQQLKGRKIYVPCVVLVVVLFLPLVIKLIQIHPFENAYFNLFAGGLSGARGKDIPYWGNTFGGGYRKAVDWINKNAEYGSKVAFAYELLPNVPALFFRKDLQVTNQNKSGYLADGEYVITLTFDGVAERSYFDMYLDRMVEPVYFGSVDGVPVVKVWKNDIKHRKEPYLKEQVLYSPKVQVTDDGVTLDLGKNVSLSRIEASVPQINCASLSSGWFLISKDAESWTKLSGNLPNDWAVSKLGEQPKGGRFIYPFAGDRVRYIDLKLNPKSTCLFKMYNLEVFYFPDDIF